MFYDKFKKTCELKNTSVLEVSKKLGIPRSSVSTWKTKGLQPNVSTMTRIADFLGISVYELLPDEVQAQLKWAVKTPPGSSQTVSNLLSSLISMSGVSDVVITVQLKAYSQKHTLIRTETIDLSLKDFLEVRS